MCEYAIAQPAIHPYISFGRWCCTTTHVCMFYQAYLTYISVFFYYGGRLRWLHIGALSVNCCSFVTYYCCIMHMKMLYAILGWLNNSPSMPSILVSQFSLRNMGSIVAVKSLWEMVSHWHTPLSCWLSCSILKALSPFCLYKCISAVLHADIFIPFV